MHVLPSASRSFFLFTLLLVFTGVGCNQPIEQVPANDDTTSIPQEVMHDSPEIMLDEDESMKSDPDQVSDKVEDQPVEMEANNEVPAVKEDVEQEKEVEVEVVVPEKVVKSFDITAKQWEFVPSVITVDKGDTVRLSVKSVDVSHGLSISAFGINEQLEPGLAVQVEFEADKKGTFSMLCNVFCGSGHGGMKGTLIVQ
jgi:cytochrome c oxidase subunit II